jgi:uncharacterized protein (TIGR00369 family)
MTVPNHPQPPRPQPHLLGIPEIDRLIDIHFPAVHHGGRVLFTQALTADGALIRLVNHPKNMRPGGTVSGPAMFTLADYGVYVAILGHYGEAALQAVTANITLNFIRRPQPGDLLGKIRLIKPGKRLIVSEVEITSVADDALVAHVIATYAMPAS